MKKHFYFIIVCTLFSLPIFAQTGKIRGTVRDAKQQPLPGMNVGLLGTAKGASTDESGDFLIENVTPGNYTLVISGVGYEKQQRTITVNAGETVRADVQLVESTAQLQEVEIIGRTEQSYKSDYSFSATKTQTPVRDIPQSISTVTKELIADQQAYRLQDVVKNSAGVNQFSVYDDITIRGFRSSENRLLNGLRFAGNFWVSPLLVNIERVEIIKGPASAMFGNTNPGGTINMVTKKPLTDNYKAISFTAGSFNTMRVQADFTGPMNKEKTLLYRLNIGYEDAESFRDYIDTKTLAIAPSISFRPSSNTQINFDLTYTDYRTKLDRGRPIFQNDRSLLSTPINFNIGQPNDILRPVIFAGILSLNQKLSEHLTFTSSYMKYRENQELREHGFNDYITPDSISLYYTDRRVNYTNDNITNYFTATFNTGEVSHTLLAGYDYIRYQYTYSEIGASDSTVGGFSLVRPQHYVRPVARYNLNEITPVGTYDSYYHSHGIYLQEQLKWKRLQLLLSLRQEWYVTENRDGLLLDLGVDDRQQALLPRVGLVYALRPNINVYATYNRGFQPVDPSLNANPRSGGPFDPLYSVLYEVGAKGEFFNQRLLGSLALYNLEQNNVLVNANDPGNPDLQEQRGQERAQGVEVEATGMILPNLSVQLSYAYNDARITESSDEAQVGLRKENAPHHVSGSWVKYTIDRGKLRGLGVGLGHSQVSDRTVFEPGLILPSYVIFNGAAYYTIDKFRFAVNVNNITDKTHWIGGYNYQRNFPGAPRNFLVSVGYTF